jgi:hypothetical protein
MPPPLLHLRHERTQVTRATMAALRAVTVLGVHLPRWANQAILANGLSQ